jgi:hypothetical protein
VERWINLIMMCVCMTHFFVLVNGIPMGQITLTRGIRQGDPISPYLFLICAKVLSSLLSRADWDGTMRGVPPDSLGREFQFFLGVRTGRLDVRTGEAGSFGFLGCSDIPLTCPDTARVKTVSTRFHLISSALLPLPRDFLPSLT